MADQLETVEVDRLPVRLGQFLQLAGIADTGADAKTILASGEVEVDAAVEHRRGRQLHNGAVVTVGGQQFLVDAAGHPPEP